MAFDQNSIPKNICPLNTPRTMPEDSRVAPIATSGRPIEGFYANPPRDISGAESIPSVYYPSAVSDTGFVGLGGYAHGAPGVPGYVPHVLPPGGVNGSGINLVNEYGYNSNLGTRVNGNDSNQSSDECGGDSVFGKKVKFLCSFGGKIFPRPSDGSLRYVGGQTRIINVRRDVSFSELIQKMVDIYGQTKDIKYQLPDEDLDALVSVSCPDDVENMMDEYEKLVERSSDGSAKLRLFLFSAPELGSSSSLQFRDSHDSGQRYFDAVNGITDAVGGSIARKESIASATSTQNSDLSGVVDSVSPGEGDATVPASVGMLSPRGNAATCQEIASTVMSVEPNAAIHAEASAAPSWIPVVKSVPPPILSAQPELQSDRSMPITLQQQRAIGYDLQTPGMTFPPPTPYSQAYTNPDQETLNHANHLHLHSQMGFPTQLFRTVGPVFTQQQIASGFSSQQFVPAVHMTMASSSHVSMRPNVVPSLVQPQQIQLERYPEESTLGQRVVQLPADQSYKSYQVLVPPAMVGGHSWHQVPQPEQMAFPEGWVPHQQMMVPEKLPAYENCDMCQKALPHAHSDTLAQGQRGSLASTLPDLNPMFQSPQLDDRVWPLNKAVVSGALRESVVEHQAAGGRPRVLGHIDHEPRNRQAEGVGISQNVVGQYENSIILQNADNHDHDKVLVPQVGVGLAGGVQTPYGVIMATLPQSCREISAQQLVVPIQNQVKQDVLINKPGNSDIPPVGGMPLQTSDLLNHEYPKDNSGKLPGVVPKGDTVEAGMAYDHFRHINGRMDSLWIRPPEVLVSSEMNKSPVENPEKDGILENRLEYINGREAYLDNTFSKPNMVLDSNCIKASEMLPSSNEASYLNNYRPVESYEVAQPPHLANPGFYQQSTHGINCMTPDDIYACNTEVAQPPYLANPSFYQQSTHGINRMAQDDISVCNPAFSCVDTAHLTQTSPPIGELKDNPSQFQPKVVPSDVKVVMSDGNTPSSISPSNRTGDLQDSSLFSNQDPWMLQHDTHFLPPRSDKLIIKKEGFDTRDPFGNNCFGNIGESFTAKGGGLTIEMQLDEVPLPSANPNTDCGAEYGQSNEGSGEEVIKQELQAVAEGVAACVLQSSMPSDPDLTVLGRSESPQGNQNSQLQHSDGQIQHRDKIEDINTKLPAKANLGFPPSDGIGRLQIIKNSDLEELRELGSGTFGTVFHGKWRGSDVAIKRINDRCFAGKPSEEERMRDDFWNEAIKLADLHHPNVVAFYGVVLDGPGGSVATVTEYMVNGSLRNALQKNERNLDKRKRLLIAMDVAFGMEYLHGKNIVHFDLKSDNLLVNLRDPHRPICKVGDLGLSKVKCQTLISGGVRGTLPWMAPELLNGSSSLVSEKVDVFSFGIVMWELLTREEPYADLHYGAIIGGIVSNTLRPPVPETCNPEWRSLMETCWSSEPSERPSFTEIANELRSMAAKVPQKGQTQ